MKSELAEKTTADLGIWTLVTAGGDEDATDRLSREIEKGYIEATSLPQKYEYEKGKLLYYMRVDEIEKVASAYVLLGKLYESETVNDRR